ncbi:alpha/beta fold hydrolase [Sinisalibacter aestuarii]|uniref:Hydrolase n=1 Tax=Sinisalibacter aestuarii TaxID=2949426 RepID=A0ABQ5LUQ8_9RHOB|nr:alpha/beta hydrolase [Sinisalibacter aestuarii]GKY88711.1 hydrolase [Sinisalibacter aestuarii]
MEAAPYYEDVADAPPGGQAWWCNTRDGMRIRVAVWPVPEGIATQGTVLLFPGRTEYIEKYGPSARAYASQGFATLTLDWRGQGLTARAMEDRRLGHVIDFAEYQTDLAAALDLARALDLPRPRFLVAHSMGGCIGLRALHEGLDVRAVAFSAPMWGMQMETWERPLAWLSALAAPLPPIGRKLTPRTDLDHALYADPFEGNDLTTDRAMWDFMRAQLDTYPDLTLGGPTIRWLRAALFETRALRRLAPPNLPALTFLGTGERIVEPGPVKRLMRRWPGGRLELIEGAEHEIMMERAPVRDRFHAESAQLFLTHR